jgi:large subunit ribosomal protein L10
VAQDFDLRRKIAGTGARYKVVKNSLIERAAKGTAVEPIAQKLAGTTSVAFTETDPVALAKALTEYAKGNPILTFKCGVVEGRVVSLADLTALATLPSKEQLLSKVLFLLNSPAQRVASTLSGVARNLAYVISQAVKEGKFRDKNEEGDTSDTSRRLMGAIGRWLGIERGASDREQAAQKLLKVAESGEDPCNVDSVLPLLEPHEVHVRPQGSPPPLGLKESFYQLPDSEKTKIRSFYQSEYEKLKSAFPGISSQTKAPN